MVVPEVRSDWCPDCGAGKDKLQAWRSWDEHGKATRICTVCLGRKMEEIKNDISARHRASAERIS